MMNNRTSRSTTILALLASATLAGCSLLGGPDGEDSSSDHASDHADSSATSQHTPSTVTSTSTVKADSSSSESTTDVDGDTPRCSGHSAEQALQESISQVRPWEGGVPWSSDYPQTGMFDDCAALSAIVITIEGATGSSPFHILLYHYGEYLGTATYEPYGFSPTVDRVDDATLSVIYHWPRPGEGTANRTGESHAEFHWDEEAQKVIMSGELPPD
ncbi:hypothetical protein CCICO_00300 [Corynebacterium ciconiae DSM 44920]|uniref:LppP/LprE family lipoprotein n=1 Tax=Corynebacterium ciconiae TaxID=227319 RepID=UPI001FCB0C95|nr:LppP/LprE family lipoprotein [Corynebacterium ciconiae]WKD60123.1 hypothetical protein CCICO_00300 [Corynebacterium ciconiae DSM 44920]